jgi:hypothetical protein
LELYEATGSISRTQKDFPAGIVWQFANVWEPPQRQNNNAKRAALAEPKWTLRRAPEKGFASVLLLPTKFDTPVARMLLCYFLAEPEKLGDGSE